MGDENRRSIPYVGPRPFERREHNLFFGRDRETSELLSLIISHRTVLLHAQSGAGKTSLLNASLIPQLEDELFDVLPIARVKGLIPANLDSGEISNLFVFNTLLSWVDKDDDLNRLARMTINDFIQQLRNQNDKNGMQTPIVMIFDQFEEIFFSYQERWQDRKEFIKQLANALETDHLLRLVLVIREDYIAQLSPHSNVMPEKLRIRYRLACLKKDAALAAVKGPLSNSRRSFGAGVAETLVDDLLKIRVETFDRGTVVVNGEFIEPVQLQVVCQRLWETLPAQSNIITKGDLQAFGDVNQALQEFYENSIQKTIAQTDINEGVLRGWFKNKIITPAGTRGTAYRGPQETAGIPNSAIDILESQHLIRGEIRGGARWYELTHDRFIEPILTSNQEWLAKSDTEQTRQWLDDKTAIWLSSGSGKDDLLTEIEVVDAERLIEAASVGDEKFSDSTLALVATSKTELEQQRQRVLAKLREAQRLRRLVVALIGAMIIALVFAWYAYKQRGIADQNAERAFESAIRAEESEKIANTQARAADSLKAEAYAQAEISRQLAFEAKEAEEDANLAREDAEKKKQEAIDAWKKAEEQEQIAKKMSASPRRQLKKMFAGLVWDPFRWCWPTKLCGSNRPSSPNWLCCWRDKLLCLMKRPAHNSKMMFLTRFGRYLIWAAPETLKARFPRRCWITRIGFEK